MTKPNQIPDKVTLVDLFSRFIESRPGLDFANYGDAASYRAECRRINRDLHDARALLRHVERLLSYPAEYSCAMPAATLLDAMRGTRLSLSYDKRGKPSLDYTTGQYYPTEYRPVAARILARALWCHYTETHDTGDTMRAKMRRILGASLAKRFFG